MSINKKIRWFYHVIFRHFVLGIKSSIYRTFYGMDIGEGVLMSLKVKLDKTNPKGIHIGSGTYMAFGATILTHDMSRNSHKDVFIGKNCFLGANCIVMPGVVLGDSVVVGAGSVVTKKFESNVVIAGNPAKIIQSGIKTKELGIIVNDQI